MATAVTLLSNLVRRFLSWRVDTESEIPMPFLPWYSVLVELMYSAHFFTFSLRKIPIRNSSEDLGLDCVVASKDFAKSAYWALTPLRLRLATKRTLFTGERLRRYWISTNRAHWYCTPPQPSTRASLGNFKKKYHLTLSGHTI